jgi:hypothetical protein
MPVPIEEKLAERGWTKEEIAKAARILHPDDTSNRIYFQQRMNPVVYWMTLIISIIANMVVSVVLIPFMLTIRSAGSLYLVVALLAVAFGFFFNLLLTDIEHIDPRHHVIAGIFIPALAVINTVIVINVTTVIDKVLFGTQFRQNALAVAVVYVVAFIAPYLITRFIDYMETRKRSAQTF